jgi:hypothetical protein
MKNTSSFLGKCGICDSPLHAYPARKVYADGHFRCREHRLLGLPLTRIQSDALELWNDNSAITLAEVSEQLNLVSRQYIEQLLAVCKKKGYFVRLPKTRTPVTLSCFVCESADSTKHSTGQYYCHSHRPISPYWASRRLQREVRRAAILVYWQQNPRCKLIELIRYFKVSGMTLNRDLNTLRDQGHEIVFRLGKSPGKPLTPSLMYELRTSFLARVEELDISILHASRLSGLAAPILYRLANQTKIAALPALILRNWLTQPFASDFSSIPAFSLEASHD